MTNALIEFLEARLADDDREFAGVPGDDFWLGTADLNEAWIVGMKTRMRAEANAKRRIIKAHPHVPVSAANQWGRQGFGCRTCHDFDGITTGEGWCPTLTALAMPYADHPDYEERWRLP